MKKIIGLLGILTIYLMHPTLVLAQLGSGGCGSDEIDTAIGCIPIGDQNSLAGVFLRWAIGIGGGVAFILIIVAGFQMTTSSVDPKKLQASKELLTSAIGGLLLLIFSVFLLELIGVKVLGIL